MSTRIKRVKYSKEERENILVKTNGKCAHCGKELKSHTMTIEHIFPLYKGGTDTEYNIVALCYDCNQKKANFIYSIRSYYNYIDERYLFRYEEEFYYFARDIKHKHLFYEEAKVYDYIPSEYRYMLNNLKIKNENKLNSLYKKFRRKLILEYASESDIKDILTFRNKMESKYNLNTTFYNNEYKIRNMIDYGELYVLRTGDCNHTVVGLFGIVSIKLLNVEIPDEVKELCENTGLKLKYVNLINDIDRAAYQVVPGIIPDIHLKELSQNLLPTLATIKESGRGFISDFYSVGNARYDGEEIAIHYINEKGIKKFLEGAMEIIYDYTGEEDEADEIYKKMAEEIEDILYDRHEISLADFIKSNMAYLAR